jgi:hypothetical protein
VEDYPFHFGNLRSSSNFYECPHTPFLKVGKFDIMGQMVVAHH